MICQADQNLRPPNCNLFFFYGRCRISQMIGRKISSVRYDLQHFCSGLQYHTIPQNCHGLSCELSLKSSYRILVILSTKVCPLAFRVDVVDNRECGNNARYSLFDRYSPLFAKKALLVEIAHSINNAEVAFLTLTVCGVSRERKNKALLPSLTYSTKEVERRS